MPEPVNPSYQISKDEDGDYSITLQDEDQVYELIRDLSQQIANVLTHRFDLNLGGPCDDQASDINNTIEFLNLLMNISYI